MSARLPRPPDSGLPLALAIVASSTAPLILLDGELRILAASDSFYRAFGVDSAEAVDRPFRELQPGRWDVPQLSALLIGAAEGTAAVDAYEMDLQGDGPEPRRLVIGVHRLDYGHPEQVRLLVSVADVTEARLAAKLQDDLLREKAVLQEIQHRVANSLQIIASVILQSARKVQSEETRIYLQDAHNRVMSVATLQQQLAASQLGNVALRPYFEQLCRSIGASMIRDHKQLTLVVEADDSTVSADDSVSLGLVVTELVINALKHAFPGGRAGRIVVGYKSTGPDWSLSVADDGVGMPPDADSRTPGLGTSIVAALAQQLRAEVRLAESGPGTRVSLVHDAASADARKDVVPSQAVL